MSRDGTKTGGRLPGTPNKATAATRARIENEADPIGFLTRIQNGEGIEAVRAEDKNQPGAEPLLVYPTLDQRMAAAKTLADKLVPNPKSRAVQIELPPIKGAGDVLDALGKVFDAMAQGEITIDECQQIAAALELHRKAIETADIDARLAALERAQEKK